MQLIDGRTRLVRVKKYIMSAAYTGLHGTEVRLCLPCLSPFFLTKISNKTYSFVQGPPWQFQQSYYLVMMYHFCKYAYLGAGFQQEDLVVCSIMQLLSASGRCCSSTCEKCHSKCEWHQACYQSSPVSHKGCLDTSCTTIFCTAVIAWSLLLPTLTIWLLMPLYRSWVVIAYWLMNWCSRLSDLSSCCSCRHPHQDQALLLCRMQTHTRTV